MSALRSILAATDLGSGSDAIVASAARLAARSEAELHLLHALELAAPPPGEGTSSEAPTFQGRVQRAEEGLRAQVERTMPAGFEPASQRVIIYIAHRAILDRAREVSADLIVIGPHRGGETVAHVLGTTADRVIRTAEVPCLVLRAPLADPLRRIGVPVDFSPPSQAALETALAWALDGAAPGEGGSPGAGPAPADGSTAARAAGEIRAMHVARPVEGVEQPELEGRIVAPQLRRQVEHAVEATGAEDFRVERDVLWDDDVTNRTLAWAAERELDLLVMGTHGRGGLARALIGSVASKVTRQAPCPVLLVPPAAARSPGAAPRLERIVAAVDFSDASLAAARWSASHLAPAAEHVLLHVLETGATPDLFPAGPRQEELLRRARGAARERLEDLRGSLATGQAEVRAEVREGAAAQAIVALAQELAADAVVMGESGHRGGLAGGSLLGSTAERVLRSSPVPVLVARGPSDAPPRAILAAVDGSVASRRALTWAHYLADRFDGSLTVLFVEKPFVYAYAGTLGEPSQLSAVDDDDAAHSEGWRSEREEWLREQVRAADVDPATATLRVAEGRPPDRILEAREQTGADLVVVGSHGRGALGRIFLGSVSGAVLRRCPGPVLLVPEATARASG